MSCLPFPSHPSLRFNVFNCLTQLFRQPGIQVVNIANNHLKPLIKTSFHFSCYTKKGPAILLLFADILRQRMFIVMVLNNC